MTARWIPVKRPALCLPLLPHLADGLTNTQIGDRMQLASGSIGSRLKGLYYLLGVDDRTAAVSQAYRRRLLDLDTGQLTHKAHSLIAANHTAQQRQEET